MQSAFSKKLMMYILHSFNFFTGIQYGCFLMGSKAIAFRENEKNGLMQHMVRTNVQNAIKLNASTKDPKEFVQFEAIFSQNTSTYYCSLSNSTNLSNYFIIEFVDRFVYPSGYVIRSNSYGFLKSWMLEGSLDGEAWDLLHSNFNTSDLSSSYKWYKINKRGQYRFFKITQTGESGGDTETKMYRLRISYLDFFGFMSNGQFCTNKACLRGPSKISLFMMISISCK